MQKPSPANANGLEKDRSKRPKSFPEPKLVMSPVEIFTKYKDGPFYYQYKTDGTLSRMLVCDNEVERNTMMRNIRLGARMYIDGSVKKPEIVSRVLLLGEKIRSAEQLKRQFEKGPFHFQVLVHPVSKIEMCDSTEVLEALLCEVAAKHDIVIRPL
ncbi:hypothetical protein A3C20_04890 [Candidatus Kaiserbacteria bacterium RIFCSPHIGHO2_02_FULL_55_25]|uniref:Uncharacterized protein n=1 Tax=Candidatus Kaiserbacteria bacterium RIFCSPHIGHO2_02_FULL_55_25 TaxID=1798498 RepID=A0A1F6E5T2_9BACT|nr:MAG: hypothetical protein A2764_02675 [Candidatus Kaiserbacteria bacterium RIFCSPHIGHO2_01_FULL_55_79]OGG69054.1 MAG: hypothetical protein A3C20_04890 [Candidatus Kaiserbacteria bacterium RIFCSPHIGHO2_02_FULL_55_25]OGG77003.1 MAG: hypothetical protein A3F56_01850 [Candidatus Kaiserbacteria bacterium RIFCSPHIGHO2_12_FULL_55_13]